MNLRGLFTELNGPMADQLSSQKPKILDYPKQFYRGRIPTAEH